MNGKPVARVVLTGFMGAGKSTVGALLAVELGWRFIDIDRAIVAEHGISIAELFTTRGEAGFRELEAHAVRQALLLDQAVIALGGGALESAHTRDLLFASPGTHIIFLETPLEVALARCAGEPGGAIRPVLADRSQLESRYTRRLEHYRRAHHSLSTADRSPAELVLVIRDTLASFYPVNQSGA
jgi:shikimate kinase